MAFDCCGSGTHLLRSIALLLPRLGGTWPAPPRWDEAELVRIAEQGCSPFGDPCPRGRSAEIGGNLLQWEEAIASVAHAGWNSTVLLLFADAEFQGAFWNLIYAARAHMNMTPVIVALHNEVVAYFDYHRVPVARFVPAPWSGGKLNAQGFLPEVLRYLLTYRFLLRELRVIYADADVFFVGDPRDYFDPSVDVLVEAHAYSDEVCSGFFMAQPTAASLDLFRSIVLWIRDTAEWVDHQLVLDYALRGKPNMRLPGDGFPESELTSLRAHSVRWSFLPLRQFMHYTSPRRPWTPPTHVRLGDELPAGEAPLVLAHIWSGAGPSPVERVMLACSLGYWVSPLPPEDPFHRLRDVRCLWCIDGWPLRIQPRQYRWCAGFGINGSGRDEAAPRSATHEP